MTYHFNLSSEASERLHLLLALGGGSGCGKTYTAMTIAEGLSGDKPFAVIDTEANRAMHYKSRFNFAHCDFSPFDAKGNMVGYSPERYIDVIDAAEKAGYPVIVVDSFSHVWEGMGGVLEMQAEEVERLSGGDPAKKERVSIMSWQEPKRRYRRLIHRIIQCRADVILCIRAKERVGQWSGKAQRVVYVGKSKIRREDLGWDVACDKDLIFEMTSSFLLTPERPGVVIPLKLNDEHRHAFPPDKPVTVAAGKAMMAWAVGDNREGDKKLFDQARSKAREGFEPLNAYWKTLGTPERDKLMPIMPELKEICQAASKPAGDDLPFDQTDNDDEGETYAREIARRAEEAMAGK